MRQRSAARTVSALAAVAWAVGFFGIIDLAVPLLRTPGFEDVYLLETGWGLLYTVLAAVPFVALALRPERPAPVLQIALVAVALAVPAVLTPALGHLLPATALLAAAGLVRLLAVGRRRPFVPPLRRRDVSPPLAALAAVAAVPALLYAADMVAAARDRRYPVDVTNGLDHWPAQAALALAVVGVAALAAARPDGWRIAVWCAAVTAAWLGALAIAYPGDAGSPGAGWGMAAVGWSGALLVAARRPRVAGSG